MTAMSSSTSRKRPAPGANPLPATPTVPVAPAQQPAHQYASHEQMMRWNGVAANGNNYTDVPNQFMALQHPQASPVQQVQQLYQSPPQPQSQPQAQPQVQIHPQAQTPSNVLARRETNARALVPTTLHPTYDAAADPWASTETALIPSANGRVHEPDPERELMEALAKARKLEEESKKDNPGQKRTIPPFVKKLATFLNDGKNSDLIRWSDKGDSFLVLDEDEFAKKLIPEMFKHNNYASFVRQLNMYGFHKRVGLSDNSMRASEKKNKSPSEYTHQYFRRGYDILQWLIQKPNKSAAKRKGGKRDVPEVIEPDTDEEYGEDQYAVSGGRNEAGPLARTEMGKFREQLAEVQHKQQQVLAMIHSLRQNQQEIMNKAQHVEELHQRHENSIGAILTFLANVFRKSLEGGKGSAEHLTEMLANILPLSGQGSMPTGTVQDLDLGDILQDQTAARNSMSPVPQKRMQHLLPGIPAKHKAVAGSAGRVVSEPPSPAELGTDSGQQVPQSSRVTEVYDTSPADTTSPNYYRSQLQSNPQDAMMKLMGATNARMTQSNDVDLPEVAATTPASMPSDQRNRILSSMSRRTASPVHNLPFSPPAVSPDARTSMLNSGAPATVPLRSVTPPQPANALSPLLANSPRAPLLKDVTRQQQQLHEIENSLGQVGDGIRDLAQIAGQLSPSGRIPGFDITQNGTDENQEYFPHVGVSDFDLDQWVNPGDFEQSENLTVPAGDFDVSDFNFDVGENNDLNFQNFGHGLDAPATATKDTPSPAVTEEIQRTDLDGVELPAAKRPRQS